MRSEGYDVLDRSTLNSPTAARRVVDYSPSYHRWVLERGDVPVSSPFAAWFLLVAALSGTNAASDHRQVLERVSGVDVGDASRVLNGFLFPPASVGFGLGLWANSRRMSPLFWEWLRSLPASVTVGAVPSVEKLDWWVSGKSRGANSTYPFVGDVFEDERGTDVVASLIVSASTLWAEPFEMVDSQSLRGRFGAAGSAAMLSAASHRVGLVDSDVGVCGVHVGHGADGVNFVSAIGPEHVGAADMLDVVSSLAFMMSEPSGVRWLDAREVGPSDVWEVVPAHGLDTYDCAVLPPFEMSERSSDLSGMPGLSEVAESLAAFGMDGSRVVSNMMVRLSFRANGLMQRHDVCDVAEPDSRLVVRFNRPFATVGFSTPPPSVMSERLGGWSFVPVVSAWVDERSLA